MAVLQSFLGRWGYGRIETAGDVATGLRLVRDWQPDLIMLDIHMAGLDGFAFLERLSGAIAEDSFLPVLVISVDSGNAARRRALAWGAHDVVTKPFDPSELQLRTENLLETRRLHRELDAQRRRLEALVRIRTNEVVVSRQEVLDRLALVAEYRDDTTREQARRLGHNTGVLATALRLPGQQVADLSKAAPLHDLGKVAIADHVLGKPGRLDAAEYDLMKTHTTLGAEMLRGSPYPVLEVASRVALAHHEHFDGGGYPYGLEGEEIPLAARIISIVDVFDSLVHARVYREAWTVEEARAELEAQSGRQFDPDVVTAFLGLLGSGQLLLD